MSETTLPKPLAAYVGLVVATVEDARGTDRSAAAAVAHLPLATVVQLLTARQRYDQLAVQGDVIADAVVGIVRQRFGSGADEADEWIGEQFASLRTTTTGGPNGGGSKFEQIAEEFETLIEDTLVDPLDEAAERLAEQQAAADEAAFAPATPPEAVKPKPAPKPKAVKQVTPAKPKPVAKAAPIAKPAKPAKSAKPNAASAPSPVLAPTPTPTPTPAPAPAAGPTPTPLQQLDSFSVAPGIGAAAGGLKSASDLPLADFDHMSGPQLRGRLRTLDRVQLVQLLDYERAHAHRVGIVLMLENRLVKLNAAG